MKRRIKIPVAMLCAFGMGAAAAQTVQRDGVVVGSTGKAPVALAQASTTAPIQVAQAGGAATGASAGGGAATGLGLGTTLVVVGAAVAAIVVTVDDASTVTH